MKSQTSNKGAAAAGSSMDVALRVLGVRDHSCFEMEQKLLSRGFDEAEVQETLGKLQGYGYLDDERFAVLLARSNRGLGRRGLARKMAQKGITSQISETLLEQIDEDEELARALAAARKHSPTSKISSLDRETWQRRLSSFLARRGFSTGVILNVCRQLEDELAQGAEVSFE